MCRDADAGRRSSVEVMASSGTATLQGRRQSAVPCLGRVLASRVIRYVVDAHDLRQRCPQHPFEPVSQCRRRGRAALASAGYPQVKGADLDAVGGDKSAMAGNGPVLLFGHPRFHRLTQYRARIVGGGLRTVRPQRCIGLVENGADRTGDLGFRNVPCRLRRPLHPHRRPRHIHARHASMLNSATDLGASSFGRVTPRGSAERARCARKPRRRDLWPPPVRRCVFGSSQTSSISVFCIARRDFNV